MWAESLDHEVPRRLEKVVSGLLAEEPVVALLGPRTVGKSTLLSRLAVASGRPRVDLDEPATRAAALADPALFVTGDAPVLIDEYQRVPGLLDAIKAELNRDLSPGRYVLTGSTTYGSVPLTAQSLTGRLHRVIVWPLSQGEIDGAHETFVDDALRSPVELADGSQSTTARDEYIARLVRGGMPLAARREPGTARHRWFDDYVSLVVERDVLDLARVRQRAALPRLLGSLAAQTGGLLSVAAVGRRVGLEPSTAESYTRLLEAAFLVHRLPAWGRTLRSRAGATPKLHVIDSGLAARLGRITAERLARPDAAALTELGHLVETFAVNEILKQASWRTEPVTAGHFRTRDGSEVDLVLERDDGAVLGIEVKASSGLQPRDAAGLSVLRAAVGDAFLGGVVLYLGRRSYRMDGDIFAVPLDRLWRPG